MYAKSIKYIDFNGVEREERLYFNLSRAEVTELQLVFPGGYAEYIDKITKAQDRPKIIDMFKDLMARSYGVKSDDGRRLMKSAELYEEFTQTGAYDEFFMKLCTDAEFATEFIAGVIPDFGDPEGKAKIVADAKADLLAKTQARIEEKKQDSE